MPQNVTGVEQSAQSPNERQTFINFRRNNLRAIRAVLNVGETLSEFVRAAAAAEVARRRAEDEEI